MRQSPSEYHIEDIVVPEQLASPGRVTEVRFPEGVQNIVGTVHSHGSTKLGNFSTIDESNILANHNINILAAEGGTYKARVRAALPCGHLCSDEAKVMVVMPTSAGDSEFLKEAQERIRRAAPYGGTIWPSKEW